MNKISTITRSDIIDIIKKEDIKWNGRLDEIEFLSRLYDLNNMPSTDSRFKNASLDIWQHRVNNYDWEDNWVFTDSRFNLMYCDDATYLNFLSEMLHPFVRGDANQVLDLQKKFNVQLSRDNFELFEKSCISQRPIFAGRQKILGKGRIEKSKREIEDYLSFEYINNQTNLMDVAIENNPELAIGISKELIETICLTILNERNIEIDKDLDLLQLFKFTTKHLNLRPEGIQNDVKAAKSIKTILGSLTAVVQGIGELRNQYGSGHGKRANFRGLTSRHAKLSVGSATTLAVFLIETHRQRQ